MNYKDNMQSSRCIGDSNEIFLFKMVLLIVGVLTVFLIPPLNAPDEDRHFLNAYAISRGDFLMDADFETGEGGKWYPQYILDFHDKYKDTMAGNQNAKYNFHDAYFDSWLPVTSEARLQVFNKGKVWGLDNPIAFLVQATGMRIGSVIVRLMGENLDTAYNLLLMGRLVNFIVFYLIVTAAISKTLIFKRTMMAVALLPMTLFLSASLSYDALVISISMFLFAEVFNLLLCKDYVVSRRTVFTLFLCALVLSAIKIVYFPFFILCFFIPKEKFISKKIYWGAISAVLLGCLVGFIIPSIVYKINSNSVLLVSDERLIQQRAFFFGNLREFPVTLINTFHEYKYFYLNSFVGDLGVLDTNYPTPVSAIIFCALLLVTFSEAIKVGKLNWKIKIINFFVVFVAVLGSYIYIYLTWTPKVIGVGANIVSGVQGRYFIPLYVFVAMLFGNDFASKCSFNYTLGDGRGVIWKSYMILVAFSVPVIVLLRYWI